MLNLPLTYNTLITANKAMFKDGLLKAAYHALSCALYVALTLEDDEKVKDVERTATEQYGAVKNDYPRPYCHDEPTEAALYASLIEVAAIRGQLQADKIKNRRDTC